jgi:hypothetical protein
MAQSVSLHRSFYHRAISKVAYRPIEAAIRWSGLAWHESEILEALNGKTIPDPDDFPRWPALRLNTERIYDAIAYKELPCRINDLAVQEALSTDHPDLTVRHVDLKSWMTRYYPEQQPEFLFGRSEQTPYRFAADDAMQALDAVQALVLERDALKAQIEQHDQVLQNARTQHDARLSENAALVRANNEVSALSSRSETTYLHIVGAMLDLLLGSAPSGQRYSSFRSEDAIMTALIAHHGRRLGISERTLQAKFAAAKRALARD